MKIYDNPQEVPQWDDPNSYKELLEAEKARYHWPKEPYIALGFTQKEQKEDRVYYYQRVWRLPIGLSHSSVDKVKYYINKGWTPIEFWIPQSQDDLPPPSRQGDLLIESGWALEFKTQEGRRRMADLRDYIQREIMGQTEAVEQKRKIKTLEQKLADAEAKLAKAK
jgi:hypothetical protein